MASPERASFKEGLYGPNAVVPFISADSVDESCQGSESVDLTSSVHALQASSSQTQWAPLVPDDEGQLVALPALSGPLYPQPPQEPRPTEPDAEEGRSRRARGRRRSSVTFTSESLSVGSAQPCRADTGSQQAPLKQCLEPPDTLGRPSSQRVSSLRSSVSRSFSALRRLSESFIADDPLVVDKHYAQRERISSERYAQVTRGAKLRASSDPSAARGWIV